MKTLFTIPMIIAIVVSGLVSLNFFESAQYGISALLTLTSFISTTLLVTLLNSKKLELQ